METRELIPRYKKALIIIFAYYALLLGLITYGDSREAFGGHENYLTPLIPIHNQYIQLALIFLVFAPISALAGGLAGGYFLAPIFLFIHKKSLNQNCFVVLKTDLNPRVSTKVSPQTQTIYCEKS